MIVHFVALLLSAASPEAATPATDAAGAASEPKEKLVCTNRPVLGSRLATERVCQTESQRKAERDMRQAQDNRRSIR